MNCRFQGDFGAVVRPKIISSLQYRMQQLQDKGIVKLDPRGLGRDLVIWPEWTARWADDDWDGDISEPSMRRQYQQQQKQQQQYGGSHSHSRPHSHPGPMTPPVNNYNQHGVFHIRVPTIDQNPASREVVDAIMSKEKLMYEGRTLVGNDEQKDEGIQQDDEVNPPPPYTPAAYMPSHDAPAQTSNSTLVMSSPPTKEKDLPQTHAVVNTANSALMVPSPSKVEGLPQPLVMNDNDVAENGPSESDAGKGEGSSEITALLFQMAAQPDEQQQEQQQQQKEEKDHAKQHLRCLLIAELTHLTTIIIPLARELRNARDATAKNTSNVVDVSVKLEGKEEPVGVGNRVRAAIAQSEQIEADIAAELKRLREAGVDVTGGDFEMRDVRGVLLGCGWGGSGGFHFEVAFMWGK